MKSASGVSALVAFIKLIVASILFSGCLPAQRRQKDVAAGWTKTHGKSYFGCKLSVRVDRRHKLIRGVKVSDACEADTRHLVDLLDRSNGSRKFWVDRCFHDKPQEGWLKPISWRPYIQRKGLAGKPISKRSKARSKRIASSHDRVELSLPASQRWAAKWWPGPCRVWTGSQIFGLQPQTNVEPAGNGQTRGALEVLTPALRCQAPHLQLSGSVLGVFLDVPLSCSPWMKSTFRLRKSLSSQASS